MKISQVSLRVYFPAICCVLCVACWLAGPVSMTVLYHHHHHHQHYQHQQTGCVSSLPGSAASLPAGCVCFYINTQSQSQSHPSQATECGNNNTPTPPSYQLTILRRLPSLSQADVKQEPGNFQNANTSKYRNSLRNIISCTEGRHRLGPARLGRRHQQVWWHFLQWCGVVWCVVSSGLVLG